MFTQTWLPKIARAENAFLFDEQGRRFFDLFSGHGAVWLGHCNGAIAAALRLQLDRAWLVGGLATGMADEAKRLLESFFPESHKLAGFCSTGMEAAEFALRIARVHTGRLDAAGFDRSMHGKSLAMAQVTWDNHNGVNIPFLHRLPFLSSRSEPEILRELGELLAGRRISAVFVEPVQGSGGGYAASKDFHRRLFDVCRETGTLLIFDEILTGFYRTGSPFFFSDLGFVPDIILVGKAIGNGFPVSGVVVPQEFQIQPAMLPGSTYSGNPLACCAVLNTLRQMQSMNLPRLVAGIEKTIVDSLAPLNDLSVAPARQRRDLDRPFACGVQLARSGDGNVPPWRVRGLHGPANSHPSSCDD